MTYYIHKNDQTLGPLPEAEVVDGLRRGEFLSDDLACRVGDSEWNDLSFFFPLETSMPPSLPVTPFSQQQMYSNQQSSGQGRAQFHEPKLAQQPIVVYQPPPSYSVGNADVSRMLVYQANQKSFGTAFLLWLFLGGFGAHRFYVEKTGSAIAQLLLWWISIFLCFVFIGFFIIWIPALWIFIDVFLLSGWVREHNNRLAMNIGGFR